MLTIEGRVVVPVKNDNGYRFSFVDIQQVAPGRLADLAERTTSPFEIAQALGNEDLAPVILQDVAWLQPLPVGTKVRVCQTGELVTYVYDRDWYAADVSSWAAEKRAEGLAPLIIRMPKTGWKAVAIGANIPPPPVDYSVLLDVVRGYDGMKSAREVMLL